MIFSAATAASTSSRRSSFYRQALRRLPTTKPIFFRSFTTTFFAPRDETPIERRPNQNDDDDFLPGFSHHRRQPPPPPPPPSSSSSPSSTSSTTPRTNLNLVSQGEEESMPDYDEATFNPDMDVLSPTAITTGTIRAFYLSRQIDVLKIFQKQYGRTDVGPQMPIIHRNSVILVIPNTTEEYQHDRPSPVTPTGGHAGVEEEKEKEKKDGDDDHSGLHDGPKDDGGGGGVGYAVFLDFGAAIFFGLDEASEAKCLAAAEEFFTDRVTGTLRQESMMYEEVPTLEKWHMFDRTRDMITLRKIDLNTVRVVAGVIGQTVALDHYEREADALLDVFQELNRTIAKSEGHKMGVSKGKLFQLVAENNTIIMSAITKLGLLDHARPGEAVWNVQDYYEVWTSLRSEFELETRFQHLSTKLDFIAENLKFFADMMETHKSHRMEIYIIILIAAELGVSLWEHPELYDFLFFWNKLG